MLQHSTAPRAQVPATKARDRISQLPSERRGPAPWQSVREREKPPMEMGFPGRRRRASMSRARVPPCQRIQ
jgi:hypothetical protein